MMNKIFLRCAVALGILCVFTSLAAAQSGSTRPRRVPQPKPSPTPRSNPQNEPLLTPTPATSTGTSNNGSNNTAPSSASTSVGTASTSRAYALFQQQKYEDAAREARQVAANEPGNSEAWKIAGFSEYNLKRYADASSDLQKAFDLQRGAGAEDPNTLDALAKSYALNEDFERALPLLVTATSRPGVKADPSLLSLRGLAEYSTGKMDDAVRSLNAAVKANPKDVAALYYLGRIFIDRSDFPAAIAALNRATTADPRNASAWALLTTAYLQRAAKAQGMAASDADYLSAVRAGESLTRLKTDPDTVTLFAQALIGAKQYARAAAELEKVTAGANAKGVTLYLLGVSHSRAKNFPRAIAALERAAALTPDDVNIYRELGYDYEVSKQYGKALAAYEKGAQLAPSDADFKASAERVRPYAKQ
ncbi:MAG TPA: tetratricopeptide repeat protein [Pyrinomonadaceae bacterium]